MKKRQFLIPSFVAAGLVSGSTDTFSSPLSGVAKIDPMPSVLERLKFNHLYNLAGHRSHSSHGSHRSSSGGSYSYKRPAQRAVPLYSAPVVPRYTPPSNRNTTSTPPSSVLPSAPSAALKTLPGNSNKFQRIAMQVQSALLAYGYYTGGIDGIIGPESRAAIAKLQKDYNLKITGTITPELLNALAITAR